MKWPPWTLSAHLGWRGCRIRIWIPLFMLWPLVVLIWLASAPLILVLALVLSRRHSGRALLLAGPVAFGIFASMKGLTVDVRSSGRAMYVSFR